MSAKQLAGKLMATSSITRMAAITAFIGLSALLLNYAVYRFTDRGRSRPLSQWGLLIAMQLVILVAAIWTPHQYWWAVFIVIVVAVVAVFTILSVAKTKGIYAARAHKRENRS